MTDLLLAIAHNVAIFALFGVFIAEFVSFRPGIDVLALKRLARIDGLYGALALIVIIVGVLRLIYGVKGWEFYAANPWFWAKMGAFAVLGVASAPPTLTILRWRRENRVDATRTPDDREVRRMRAFFHIEALMLALIPIFAAAMARYGTF
jgi:putative membrane protein